MTGDRAPRVTVLIAVKDGEARLPRTLASVAAQTFTDWECLVVDDGSRDGTPSVLAGFAERDPRFRVLTQPRNVGLTASLALGLAGARGDVVARLDCGDTMARGRLAAQVDVLDARPDVVLCASRVRIVDPEGTLVCLGAGLAGDVDPARLDEGNPFAHTTVAFRAAPAREVSGYDVRFRLAQDYDLWTRLLTRGRAHLLGEPLVDTVLDAAGLTVLRRAAQKRYRDLARAVHRARMAGASPASVDRMIDEGAAAIVQAGAPPDTPGRAPPYAFLCAKAALASGDLAAARRYAARALFRHGHAPSAALVAFTCLPGPVRRGVLARRAGVVP